MATINGDGGDNTLTGTSADDIINGGGGNDTIDGMGGNDTLNGDDGDDTLILNGTGVLFANGGADQDLFIATDVLQSSSVWTLNGGDGIDTFSVFTSALNEVRLSHVVATNIEIFDGNNVANIYMEADFLDSFSTVQNVDRIWLTDGGTMDLTGKLAANEGGEINGAGEGYAITIGAEVTASWDIEIAGGGVTITGGSGDDNLRTGIGQSANAVFGGDGDDTIRVIQGTAEGGNGNDRIEISNNGSITANGDAGDDLFFWALNAGVNNASDLDGGSGTDKLFIQSNGNFYEPGFSVTNIEILDVNNDRVNFAEGFLANFDSIVNIGILNQVFGGTLNLTALGNIASDEEGYLLGSNSVDVFTVGTGIDADWRIEAFDGDDTLTGGNGNDKLDGGGGSDTIDGGAGTDTASYLRSFSGVTYNFVTGVHLGDAAGDTYTNIEQFEGTNHDDEFIGSAADETFLGASGEDTLSGGDGNDILFGGTDNDVLNGGNGADELNGDNGDDSLNGDDGDDQLNGGAGIDTLNGGTGDDKLDGGGGADILDGGDGVDTASYLSAVGGGIFFNFATDSHTGDAAGDTFTNIEIIEGTIFGDDFAGTSGSETFMGNRGNDIFRAFGADTLFGGDNNDRFIMDLLSDGTFASGDAGDDRFEYNGGAGAVSLTLDGGEGTDTLIFGTGFYDLSGSTATGIEILDANNENFTFTAGFLDGFSSLFDINELFHTDAGGTTDLTGKLASNDGGEFEGGDGDDVFTVGAGVTASWTILGRGGDDILIGGDGNDTINGESGDDTLNGGSGNDTLTGQGGTDILNGGDGNDTLLMSNVSGEANGGDGDDQITLESISGSNVLSVSGGDGTDTLIVGTGTTDLTNISVAEVEIFDAQNSSLTIAAGFLDGFAKVQNIEVITHTDAGGTTNLTGRLAAEDAGTFTGGSGDDAFSIGAGVSASWILNGGLGSDTLTGGDGNDAIDGGTGDDVLNGGNGDDTLDGGTGANTLTGGAGADDFVLSSSSGGTKLSNANIITDFEIGADKISLQNDSSLLDLKLEQSGTDVVISISGTDTFLAVMQNTDINNMSTSDFKDASGLVLDVVNDVPVLSGDFASNVAQSSSVVLSTSDLSASDADDPDDALIYTVDSAFRGSVQVSGSNVTSFTQADLEAGLVSFAHNGTFARDANFTFSLSDDGGASAGSATLVFSVDITPTIPGSNGDDILVGTADNDLIAGEDGDDNIDGGLGNDSILGDAGNDTIDGAGGSDLVEGGAGNDIILGGDQNDNLYGGDGNDQVLGQRGADFLYGGAGDDLVLGGNRNDRLFGEDGNDRVFGGNDQDIIDGGAGSDIGRGGNGDDILNGGAESDVLFGGTGRDTVNGDGGDDVIFGRGGFDILNGGAGDDILEGGLQADQFIFEDGFGNDTITDFASLNNAERIHLTNVTEITDFQDLIDNHMSQVGADVIIDDGSGNTITLLGVNISDLDVNDFVF